jgi:hypothetical protein
MSAPDVRVGDLWDDCDPRTPRRLEVMSLRPGHVVLRNVKTGKRTTVQIQRMRPTSTGYRLAQRQTQGPGA